MKVLAIIPARGGSKGLPRKNVLPAGERPLIGWTIEAAQGSARIDRLVLSSDDDEIIAVAQACGCEAPFKRPPELATDEATTVDVVLHVIDALPGFDYLILLQPTSPLRTATDIDAAFDLMLEREAPSCVSLCPVAESPYWMYRLEDNQQMYPLIESLPGAQRRQDLPPVYSLNGAIYIAHCDWFRHNRGFVGPGTVGYVMPRSRSIDIDTRDDFQAFERSVTAG